MDWCPTSWGQSSYQRYYLAGSDYAKAHPEVLQQVYLALREASAWTKANPAQAARILGPLWGNLDSVTVQQANALRGPLRAGTELVIATSNISNEA